MLKIGIRKTKHKEKGYGIKYRVIEQRGGF